MLTSCLPNVVLAATVGSMHREPATGWEGVWVRHAEFCGVPMGQMGRSVDETFPAAHGQDS